jgi:hypothetical protein
MADIEKNLSRYLKTETLLNSFFSSLNFCLSACIGPELQKNGNQPVAACCQKKYHVVCDLPHPAFERLREEREKLYGRPQDHFRENPVSPCEYHNPVEGCLLTTHKSPICLAFFCRKGIAFLRNNYNIITYDYLGVYYALEWILTGDLPDNQYLEFRDSILGMLERLKSRTSSHRVIEA